jgi:sRNA-binding carbon storage regulator CsrA
MLIISRKKDQKIIIADNIEITILEVGKNRVRFGINAPKQVPIHTRLKSLPSAESLAQCVGGQATEASEPQEFPAVVGLSNRI